MQNKENWVSLSLEWKKCFHRKGIEKEPFILPVGRTGGVGETPWRKGLPRVSRISPGRGLGTWIAEHDHGWRGVWKKPSLGLNCGKPQAHTHTLYPSGSFVRWGQYVSDSTYFIFSEGLRVKLVSNNVSSSLPPASASHTPLVLFTPPSFIEVFSDSTTVAAKSPCLS